MALACQHMAALMLRLLSSSSVPCIPGTPKRKLIPGMHKALLPHHQLHGDPSLEVHPCEYIAGLDDVASVLYGMEMLPFEILL